MSHIVCIALIPKTTKNLEFRLGRMMSPFNEAKRVKRYQRTCKCTEWQAAAKAREECTAKFGEFDKLRDAFWQKVKLDPELSKLDGDDDRIGAAWKEHIKDWETLEHEREAFWLPQMKPDKKCSCKGKGWEWSTYNPKSKWDWYSIGGRWTGFLAPEYKPDQDPDNIEVCTLCKGSGTRPDMPIFAEGAHPLKDAPIRHEAAKCNGCDGKGKRVKWPTSWRKFEGDIQPASRWLELLNNAKTKDEAEEGSFVPYAVLTPEGEWFQRGEMGWFGMSSDEKDRDSWGDQVKSIAEKYAATCFAVVVDCHV